MRKQGHQDELGKEQLLIEDLERSIKEHKGIEQEADKVAEWMRDMARVQARMGARSRIYDQHVQHWKDAGEVHVRWLGKYKTELAMLEKTIKEYEQDNQKQGSPPVKIRRGFTPYCSVYPTHP